MHFWKAEPRPGNSLHHSRFLIFFVIFLLGCRCISATKKQFDTLFQVRCNDSAKIMTHFFRFVAARMRVARVRAQIRFGAVLLRHTTQQKIHPKISEYIDQLEKLKQNLFPF